MLLHSFLSSCAVSNLKKCSLELGGKSPLIIFHDCDMDRAVRQVSPSCTCLYFIYGYLQVCCLESLSDDVTKTKFMKLWDFLVYLERA